MSSGTLSNEHAGVSAAKAIEDSAALPLPGNNSWDRYRKAIYFSLLTSLERKVEAAIIGDPTALSTKIALAVGGDVFGIIPQVIKQEGEPYRNDDFGYTKAPDIVDICHVNTIREFLGDKTVFSSGEASDVSQALVILNLNALYKLFHWESVRPWNEVQKLERQELGLPFRGKERLRSAGRFFREASNRLGIVLARNPHFRDSMPNYVILRNFFRQNARPS